MTLHPTVLSPSRPLLDMAVDCFLLQALRIFNTWVGDPSKLSLLQAVLQVIREDRLLDRVRDTGEYILTGLVSLQVSLHTVHVTLTPTTQLSWACHMSRWLLYSLPWNDKFL